MKVWIFSLALILVGCIDSTTYMKNEKTGQIVTCGGKHPRTIMENAEQSREAQCIQDYKEQGYVRVPGPK